ncbi:cell wall-binding repeat-containing protein [Microbacterium sp. W1N]|nr:cell wall-binding repeat-containing protein [Microbacterium festucae]
MDPPSRPTLRSLAPPVWHLPFEPGQRWSSGGPHRDSDGTAWGALDFAPGSSPNRRVVAIAEGRVYRVVCPAGWFLGVDHGGGWKSEYYHLAGAQENLIGQWVPAGAYLGEAGSTLPCGGSSNGPHVHLSILYGDPPQPGTAQRPYYPVDGMRFGNYVVRNGSAVHRGTWQDLAGNTVFSNWGCCLTSTTPTPQRFSATPAPTLSGSPAVGGTLVATASWQPAAEFSYQWIRDGAQIAGATSSTYTVTKEDRGAQLSVVAVGSRDGFWRVTQVSGAVTIPTPVSRIAGVDRYETSARLAATFAPGTDTVFVATGLDFPDALSAAAASRAASPVILTSPAELSEAVRSELSRLKPRRIVVVGGEPSVSAGVFDLLRQYAPEVQRIAGENRFETAASLSAATFGAGAPVAYLATGANFPDALSAAGPAGRAGGPVLLALRDELPAATRAELARLRPERVVVVGDSASISASVMNAAWSASGGSVTRIAGVDRYATSAAIVRATTHTPAETIYVASGEKFPDAVSGAAVAAASGAPMLITRQDRLPEASADLVTQLSPARAIVLGATDTVSEPVARAIAVRAR